MYNSESDHLRKLFLGGLSSASTEDSLRKFYSQFGEILDVTIRRDSTTGRSRGFGFITFNNEACVDRAQAARPHVLDGKTVDSKRVIARTEPKIRGSGRKIFVGGLKVAHDERSLREHFQQFGNVIGVKILVDKDTGRNRGFGYVEFEDYDSADKAVLHRNHTIKSISIDVKKSTYKPSQSKHEQQNVDQTVAGAPPQSSPYPPPVYPPPYGYPPAPPYGAPAWGPPPAGYPQQPPPAHGAPPVWNGWGYGAPVPPAANGWNSSPPANQNFGSYQQSYNGGPEKGGKLQANRKIPYKS